MLSENLTVLAQAAETSFPAWFDTALFLVLKIIYAFAAIMFVMSFAGLSVVAERKVCAFMQGRYGPNRTSIPWVEAIPFVGVALKKAGLVQLVADALKFLLKEDPLPDHVNKPWFLAAPVLALTPVLVAICVVPFSIIYAEGGAIPMSVANVDISLLLVLAVGSLGAYGAVIAGWSSNSKFPYHGGIRASAQMISYELTMGICAVTVALWLAPHVKNPLSLFEIANAQSGLWLVIVQPLTALLFLIAIFAETNRLPFDMAESETDLVSGFHTEYGSFKFGLFFVGEYGHVVVASAIFVTLFLGGWNPFPGLAWPESWGWVSTVLGLLTFVVKVLSMIFFFIWVRWSVPRFRYDQVMNLGWRTLMPLAIANLLFYMLLSALLTV